MSVLSMPYSYHEADRPRGAEYARKGFSSEKRRLSCISFRSSERSPPLSHSLGIRMTSMEKSYNKLPLSFWAALILPTIIYLTISIYITNGYFNENGMGLNQKFKVYGVIALSVFVFIIISFPIWKISDLLRKYTMPDAIYSSGSIFQQAFTRWMWEGGMGAFAVTASAMMLFLFSILLIDDMARPNQNASLEAVQNMDNTTPTISQPEAALNNNTEPTPEEVPNNANNTDLATENITASFDCSLASSKTEKLICSDFDTAKADRELSDTYKNYIDSRSEAEVNEMRSSQKIWIANVQRQCDDIDCLKSAYRSRLDEIQSLMSSQ